MMMNDSTSGRAAYAGYLPIVFVLMGASIGGAIADLMALAEWVGAIPGALVGYLASRFALRRFYSGE